MTASSAQTQGSFHRKALWLAGALPILALLGLIVLASFPWGLLKGRIEARLSRNLGQPVTIEAMERLDHMSFHPRIRLRGVRVPQPAWVHQAPGDLARVDRVDLGFSVWSLLAGHQPVERADVSGADLVFYRNAQGRKSWSESQGNSAGHAALLHLLRVSGMRLRYLDDKRRRSLDVEVTSDGAGLRLKGNGLVMGHRVTVTGQGAPVVEGRASVPWTYALALEGPDVGFALTGTMPSPLDTDHLQGQARAHALDLQLLDAIIEAGLPGTQPVRLAASVRRNRPDWVIDALQGTIGRSDISGHATIVKRKGRTRVTGALLAHRFDFDDLSSNQGKRRAAAQQARLGPRLLPGSAIDLTHVQRTDGALDLRVEHLLWPGPSPFRSLRGHLWLERGRLIVSPLTLGMTHGTMGGRLTIDQRAPGRRDPRLKVDLAIRGGRLLDWFPRARIDGGLVGRMAMNGQGHTVRDALGRGDGVVALVGRDGAIPARTAALLGQDVGGGLTTGKDEESSLRCLVVRLEAHHGIARPAPVLIDTSRGQTQVWGSIDLSDERLMLMLKGAPKGKALLRIRGTVGIAGTIKTPDIRVPHQVKTVGGVLGMLADGLTGHQEPRAHDADCNRLAAAALR
jgi:uncharacterized protein involved in outer membrane biogenesis